MRPRYGDTFRFDRVLNIYFYTSNNEKLMQARLIFSRNGYQLRHYTSTREPYDEDYRLRTPALLKNALDEVTRLVDSRSIFFVEDTSVRIEALSEVEDYPGTRMKEWFSEIDFPELNRLIAIRGGNRAVIVKSDIALRIPTLSRPIYFHGETQGTIAETPPSFEKSIQYPWLTPENFNGWFVPEGTHRRLGEMEFEESLAFDFRAKALSSVLERLEELNAAVNFALPSNVTRRSEARDPEQRQLLLFTPQARHILIVIGQKCAGKTTLSDYLVSKADGGDILCLEGSTILRGLADEDGVPISDGSSAFAFLMARGTDIVAKRAQTYIDRSQASLNVVTGFRTVEEVLYFCRIYPEARVVLVEADEQLRFERHLRRAREGDPRSTTEFRELGEDQLKFGIMRVASEVADYVLSNNSGIIEYQRKIDTLINGLGRDNVGSRGESELFRSVRALHTIGRAATCQEIESMTSTQGLVVRKYNNNRALQSIPEFAVRLQKPKELLRYRLTRRGELLFDLLSKMQGRRKITI